MFTILRFLQINLLRQREQLLSSHLFLWPKKNFELLVFSLYYYLELLPETQWVPGIKFKEKINECLCERPFEKGNAVVVGRKRGGGVF